MLYVQNVIYENNENEPNTHCQLAYYFMWEILLAIIMPHFGEHSYTYNTRGYSLWLNINNWGSTVE